MYAGCIQYVKRARLQHACVIHGGCYSLTYLVHVTWNAMLILTDNYIHRRSSLLAKKNIFRLAIKVGGGVLATDLQHNSFTYHHMFY